MYSFATTKNHHVAVYYDGRLKFVTFDFNKALHYIALHNKGVNNYASR